MEVESWLVRAARLRPTAPAVGRLTYAELLARADAGARDLHARGARRGDRVGIALAPGEDFVVALHAAHRLAAIAVPIDLRLGAGERPDADVLVDGPLGDGPATALAGVHRLADTAALIFTSGTTSRPKPVALSYGNWLWSALGSATALGVAPRERWLCALPLSHVGGLSIVLRSAIYATEAVVLPGWDTELALAQIAAGATLVSVVPTTLSRLLDGGLRAPTPLRCALVGGGPVPPALMDRAREAGIAVAQTYGLTEACSQVTTAAPGDPQADAGPPLFCTRVAIADDGEIRIKGPTVAAGSAGSGGWLATGDLGALDAEGRLTVTGRKSDTIVTGGENVAPTEVEAVLAAHPAVGEVAVHARPHPAWGEAVVATVVLRTGQHATDAQLRAWCAARLAGFKVPKQVDFATALPRTPSGKLLRRAL